MAKQLRTIKVTITNDGDTKLDAQGYKGKSCLKATEELEIALGGQVKKREDKPEMNQPPDILDRTTVGGR